ncbi:MAG: hypothetical protein HOV86_22465 [Thermoactinospora sp.]|nr:hypothetical protein [Thermoactinospora sp.]
MTGPQPERKKLRRPWRYVTSLQPGQVLSFRSESGVYVLLRVAQVDDERDSAAPHLVVLDHLDTTLPSIEHIEQLSDRDRLPGTDQWIHTRQAVYRASRFRKKDPDFAEVGFHLVDGVIRRPGDKRAEATVHMDWGSLAHLASRAT